MHGCDRVSACVQCVWSVRALVWTRDCMRAWSSFLNASLSSVPYTVSILTHVAAACCACMGACVNVRARACVASMRECACMPGLPHDHRRLRLQIQVPVSAWIPQ